MLHTQQAPEATARLPVQHAQPVSQSTRAYKHLTEKVLAAPNKGSTMSTISSRRRSSSSMDGPPKSLATRPSAIPRSSTAISQARLQVLATPRMHSQHSARTKLVSNTHSLIPGVEGMGQQLRQPSPFTQPRQPPPTPVNRKQTLPVVPISAIDSDHESVFGIAFPQKPRSSSQSKLPPRLVPELQPLAVSHRRRAFAASSVSLLSSPSTQLTSSSPGLWSASTTTASSVSWSSPSPCVTKPARSPATTRRAQTVPIAAGHRSQMPRTLRSNNNNASDSKESLQTASHAEIQAMTSERPKQKTPLGSPAPTPPRRSSSIKRSRSRSSSKSEVVPMRVSHQSPPPLPNESLIIHPAEALEHKPNVPLQAESKRLQDHHNSLQHALTITSNRSRRSPAHSQEVSDQTSRGTSATSHETFPTRLLDAAQVEMTQPTPILSSNQTARSRLAKFSKLAVLGRTSKEDAPGSHKTPPRKLQKKGPVAGTGHEGYGRSTRRNGRASTANSAAGTDSEGFLSDASRSSYKSNLGKGSFTFIKQRRTSQVDLDAFAATRLKPVVIVGGSKIVDRDSGLSATKPLTELVDQDLEGGHHDMRTLSTGYQRSPNTVKQQSVTSSTYSTSTENSHLAQVHQHKGGKHETSNHRENADYQPSSNMSPYIESWNVSQSSVAPSMMVPTEIGSDMYKVDSSMANERRKKTRRHRWNIFRRRDTEYHDRLAGLEPSNLVPTPGMSVEVTKLTETRTTPFYAILDSEGESQDPIALDEILDEAVHFLDADDEDEPETVEELRYPNAGRPQSVLLPSMPQFSNRGSTRVELPAMDVQTDGATRSPLAPQLPERSSYRPRLAHVGRIPKVKPTSFAYSPDRKSFANPFTHGTRYDAALPSTTSDVEARGRKSDPYEDQCHGTNQERSPRADWQSITSSSSEGTMSILGPPILPMYGRAWHSPDTIYTGDEDVWKEYDDFLDHVTTPIEGPSIKGGSAEMGCFTTKASLPTTYAPSLPALAKGLAIDTSLLSAPVIYASPETLQHSRFSDETHLRRSQIIAALHTSADLSSPFSIADYLGEHGENPQSGGPTSGRLSLSSDEEPTVAPSCLRGPSAALPETPKKLHHENVLQMNGAQRLKNPARHSELSYASLEISRWLSFGQILFSPARQDIETMPERHILVIDGLGNEDWSLYCAVAYEAQQVYVHDLKESGYSRTLRPSVRDSRIPPNFRRQEISSFLEPFKYPDNFFAAIIIRFPPVMSEPKLKNMISESRRVLALDGYLEMMVLDLDINNMGVLTRRALRDVKSKMTISDPNISLKPVIDNFQSVLCQRGFTKLNKFVIGVPVVGKPASSADSPVSSCSSYGSDRQHFNSATTAHTFDSMPEHAASNFSLTDLIADDSDQADTHISKLVARTGRMWWQHCFEAAIIEDGDLSQSIFSNRRVLTECKNRASTFKLLIAHAQKSAKPAVDIKRRTMSEPSIATLAIA